MSDPVDGIPDMLRIGPYDITVEKPDSIPDDDGKTLWGCYEHSKLLIQITRSQPNILFAIDTLFHEIYHAIYVNTGLGYGSSEEHVVSALATGMTQVYRDNPSLVQWLNASLQEPSPSVSRKRANRPN
jgi:hypothetical protein